MTKLSFKKTYSPLSSAALVAKEKSMMDKRRFAHCVRVSQTARELAKLNKYDQDKAALAGFVHDYAKQIPKVKYREVIKNEGFNKDLLNWNRSIWHGLVGTYFIQRDLKISDPQILQAVQRHTTADVEMTMLDKIIFMADFIEPVRVFPGVEEARKITKANLDEGVGYQLAHTLSYLINQRSKIFPRTLAAYNVWSVKK